MGALAGLVTLVAFLASMVTCMRAIHAPGREVSGVRTICLGWGVITWLLASGGFSTAVVASRAAPVAAWVLGGLALSGFMLGPALLASAFTPRLWRRVGTWSFAHHAAVLAFFVTFAWGEHAPWGLVCAIGGASILGLTHGAALRALAGTPEPMPF